MAPGPVGVLVRRRQLTKKDHARRGTCAFRRGNPPLRKARAAPVASSFNRSAGRELRRHLAATAGRTRLHLLPSAGSAVSDGGDATRS